MVATWKPPLPPPRSSPPPPTPLPLAPRIDRLDSIMKVLEDQKNVARSSVHAAERHMSMDMAVREAQLKGSLMDRVRSLENRLLQLCLEMESRGKSLPDTPLFQALKDTSSSRGRVKKTGSAYSSMKPSSTEIKQLPLQSQVQSDKIKVKLNSNSEQKKPKNEGDDSKKKATRSDKEQKSVITKKKAKPSTWFHLKLLGC